MVIFACFTILSLTKPGHSFSKLAHVLAAISASLAASSRIVLYELYNVPCSGILVHRLQDRFFYHLAKIKFIEPSQHHRLSTCCNQDPRTPPV